MKNIQINTLRNDWPIVAPITKNVYLCPKIIKEMNEETLLNKPDNEELRPYTMEEINAMLEESELKPYTKEELLEMAETGRRQIVEGKCFSTEEVLRYCGYEIPKDKAV